MGNHVPVLLEETMKALDVKDGGRYVDGTLGRAGHALEIAARGGSVLGIDRDSQALEEVEKNHKGDVIFKRIDVDKETSLAQEFGVQSIPMLMFVTPKGEYQTIVGLQPASVIESKIAELLTRSAN